MCNITRSNTVMDWPDWWHRRATLSTAELASTLLINCLSLFLIFNSICKVVFNHFYTCLHSFFYTPKIHMLEGYAFSCSITFFFITMTLVIDFYNDILMFSAGAVEVCRDCKSYFFFILTILLILTVLAMQSQQV